MLDPQMWRMIWTAFGQTVTMVLWSTLFSVILGFIPGTWLTGRIAHGSKNPGFRRLFFANLAGIGVIYFFGTVYLYLLNRFYLGNSIALWPLILACDIQPLPGDIIKCLIGAEIGKRLLPVVRNEIL